MKYTSETGRRWADEQYELGLRLPQVLRDYEVEDGEPGPSFAYRAARRVQEIAERHLQKSPKDQTRHWIAARARAVELRAAANVRRRASEAMREAIDREDRDGLLVAVVELVRATLPARLVARLAKFLERKRGDLHALADQFLARHRAEQEDARRSAALARAHAEYMLRRPPGTVVDPPPTRYSWETAQDRAQFILEVLAYFTDSREGQQQAGGWRVVYGGSEMGLIAPDGRRTYLRPAEAYKRVADVPALKALLTRAEAVWSATISRGPGTPDASRWVAEPRSHEIVDDPEDELADDEQAPVELAKPQQATVFYRTYNRDPARMMSDRNVREAVLEVATDALEDILAEAKRRRLPSHRQTGIFEIQTERGIYTSTDGLAIDPTTRTGRARLRFWTWDEMEQMEERGELDNLLPLRPERDVGTTVYVKGKGHRPAKSAGELRAGDTVARHYHKPWSGTVVAVREVSPKIIEVAVRSRGHVSPHRLRKDVLVEVLEPALAGAA